MVGYKIRAASAIVLTVSLLSVGTASAAFEAYVAKKRWAAATVDFRNGYAAGVADAAIVINEFGRSGRDLNKIEQCTNGKGWNDLRRIVDTRLATNSDPQVSAADVLLNALKDCK